MAAKLFCNGYGTYAGQDNPNRAPKNGVFMNRPCIRVILAATAITLAFLMWLVNGDSP